MIVIERTVDISKPIQTETLRGNEFKLEANAHTFRISVANNGAAVALTGSVSASMLLADGSGLTLGGSLDNGVAVLTLPQAAYGVPGRFMLAIYSVQTGATEAETVKTCIYACVGAVINTYGDQQYDPGNLIPDAETLAAYIEACQNATTAANTAAGRAETAALTAVTYAEQTGKTDAEKTQARTNIGAASDEDVSSLKSAIADTNNLVLTIPLAQGARGTDGNIVSNASYVISKNFYSDNAGNGIVVKIQSSGIQVIITEWTSTGSYVGNVGSWAREVNYRFSDKQITFTFKKSNGSNIAPSEISIISYVINPLIQTAKNAKALIENDLKRYPYNYFLQGYYGSTGSFVSATSFISCPMIIPENDEQYILPLSDTYDAIYYLWDYNNGAFSNYQNSGWLTKEVCVNIAKGKAFSFALRNKNETEIDAATATYIYYKPTILEFANLKTWMPKKIACVGDSLTEGVDQTTHVIKENYPYWLSKMFNCEVLNYGVAGADTMEYWYQYLQDFTFDNTIDTVLIMFGTNGDGIPNTLETDVYPYQNYWDYIGSYCGCYCKLIMKIAELTQNKAQIFLLTPPYTSFSAEQLNRVKTARETIKEIGVYYNIPVIDVYAECGMGAYNGSIFRPHDGCHFNAKGYHRLGTYIGSKVKSMHSEWELTDVYDDETPIT